MVTFTGDAATHAAKDLVKAMSNGTVNEWINGVGSNSYSNTSLGSNKTENSGYVKGIGAGGGGGSIFEGNYYVQGYGWTTGKPTTVASLK